MSVLSTLIASQTPANSAVPISDGSGAPGASLDAWVSSGSGGTFDLQTALDALSSTHGAILFRGASAWQALEPGVAGGSLITNGIGADPSWSFGSGGIFGTWVDAVDAAGGTYLADSKTIAFNLAAALEASAFYAKIIWLAPLLGGNLAAARVPLVDVLGVGIAGNTGFVDADFSQVAGLQGNGSSKLLDTLLKPSQLGATNNGGLGYGENNIAGGLTGSGVEPLGTYNTAGTQRFVLDIRSTPIRRFRWSNPSVPAGDTNTPTNGHYYGQRSAPTLREMFFDGASIGTDTTSDSTAGSSEQNIRLLGTWGGAFTYWGGRCTFAYLTDGTLSSGEAADLHTLLQTYLIGPTGR